MEISPEEQHEDDMETNAAVSLPSHVSEPSDSMEMGLEIQPLLSPSQHQDPIVYTSAQGFVFEDPDKNEKDAFLESLLEKPEEPVIQQTVQAASVAIAEELVGVAKDGPREQLLTRFLHHDPSTGKPTMGKWREVDGILHGLPRKMMCLDMYNRVAGNQVVSYQMQGKTAMMLVFSLFASDVRAMPSNVWKVLQVPKLVPLEAGAHLEGVGIDAQRTLRTGGKDMEVEDVSSDVWLDYVLVDRFTETTFNGHLHEFHCSTDARPAAGSNAPGASQRLKIDGLTIMCPDGEKLDFMMGLAAQLRVASHVLEDTLVEFSAQVEQDRQLLDVSRKGLARVAEIP